jgi:hypothetical protein
MESIPTRAGVDHASEAIGVRTTLRVNNTTHELSMDARLTLLDALRDVLGLTGTKKGCDQAAGAFDSPGAAACRAASGCGAPTRPR